MIGGGDYRSESYDSVYIYAPAQDSWSLLPYKLTQKKNSMAAFTVDQSIFPECF